MILVFLGAGIYRPKPPNPDVLDFGSQIQDKGPVEVIINISKLRFSQHPSVPTCYRHVWHILPPTPNVFLSTLYKSTVLVTCHLLVYPLPSWPFGLLLSYPLSSHDPAQDHVHSGLSQMSLCGGLNLLGPGSGTIRRCGLVGVGVGMSLRSSS